jgi:RNA polymerase-binding protein DksA
MIRNLDAAQVDKLRQSLVARRWKLREQIGAALRKSGAEHFAQVADEVHDLEAESCADLVVDLNLAEIDRDLDELRDIEGALLRMIDGSYGICDACDRVIDLRRLAAAPAARRCVDCQTVHERTHAVRFGHTL